MTRIDGPWRSQKRYDTSSEAEPPGSDEEQQESLGKTRRMPQNSESTGGSESKENTKRFIDKLKNAIKSQIEELQKTTPNSQSSDGSDTTSTISTANTKQAIQLLILHKRRRNWTSHGILAHILVVEKPTKRNLIGSGSYGRVHAVKIIECGASVKQRLMELSSTREEMSGVPEDHQVAQVALKSFTWRKDPCECFSCALQNETRRTQGLSHLPSFPPAHVLQCVTAISLRNEITALQTLMGLSGIQQIIGYEVCNTQLGGTLVSAYSLFGFIHGPSQMFPRLTILVRLIARLEGKLLINALEGYPPSFASRNAGELVAIGTAHSEASSSILLQELLW